MRKVLDAFDLRSRKGRVGVEIEVEGRNLINDSFGGWLSTADGSLRGESREYVFNGPCSVASSFERLDELTEALEAEGSTINASDRTSVHVHINVQQLSFKQVACVAVAYTILEELLVKFCGKSREGNLFCLRAKDADNVIDLVSNIYQSRAWHAFSSNDLRYAALNYTSLTKYGSLEFRSMRGVQDFNVIKQWISILDTLVTNASQYDSPVDIMEQFSGQGSESFVRQVLGEHADLFLEDPEWDRITYEGVRLVQPLAFSTTWSDL